jgi:hypothetical protein
VPREETLDAFVAALATRGFLPCPSHALEQGLEKIALFAAGRVPTHAARQLANGWWTSKLGSNFDIDHATVEGVVSGVYGDPMVFLSIKRPVP